MGQKINLTIVFIAVCVIGVATIAGYIVLIALHDDASGYMLQVGSILTIVIGFAGTLLGLSGVRMNVNGNLSKLTDIAIRNASTPGQLTDATNAAAQAGVTPSVPIPVIPTENATTTAPHKDGWTGQ